MPCLFYDDCPDKRAAPASRMSTPATSSSSSSRERSSIMMASSTSQVTSSFSRRGPSISPPPRQAPPSWSSCANWSATSRGVGDQSISLEDLRSSHVPLSACMCCTKSGMPAFAGMTVRLGCWSYLKARRPRSALQPCRHPSESWGPAFCPHVLQRKPGTTVRLGCWSIVLDSRSKRQRFQSLNGKFR